MALRARSPISKTYFANWQMRNFLIGVLLFCCFPAFGAMDFLISERWKRNADFIYRPSGKLISRVKYDSMSLEGLSFAPKQKVFFKNLRIAVLPANIDKKELAKINRNIPFTMEVDLFKLVFVEGEKTLSITARKAYIEKQWVLVLEGNVAVYTNGKRKAISDCVLTLDGRKVHLKTRTGQTMVFEF